MATATHIPVSEYLKTTYRPDCDYIDGEVRERNVGEQPHGYIQGILSTIFNVNRNVWGTRPLGDTRLQVTPSRYRIPDVMVLRTTDPRDGIVTWAPLLCIEILSREDRLNEIRQRVADYMSVGATAAWVIDPWRRVAYEETTEGLREPQDGILRVKETAIEVSVADIFAQLDEF
jgi:Uma2 family endonuclease